MAEMRQRTIALTLGSDEASLQDAPVSGLLEALRVGFQQKQPWAIVDVAAELLARLNEEPGASIRVKASFEEY